MSAHIVDDACINRIVYYFWFLHTSSFPRRELACITSLETEVGEQKLAGEMFMLNCQAVDQRYPGHAQSMPDAFRPLDFKYSPVLSTEMQVYKSLSCWLYQCSEGNIPETSELYKVMDRIKDYMAGKIVSELPEYQAAQWG